MQGAELLERLEGLGVRVEVAGDKLSLVPGSRVPSDLVAELRQRKAEVIALLSSQSSPRDDRARTRLRQALAQKEGELAGRRRDLASPWYQDDPWVKGQITFLEGHITEIRRWLLERGELKLPRCCLEPGLICLVAMRGFNACFMTPKECGFSLQMTKPGDAQKG